MKTRKARKTGVKPKPSAGNRKPRKATLVLARAEDLDDPQELAAFYEALTGRAPTAAELAEAFADGDESWDQPVDSASRRRLIGAQWKRP